MEPLGLFLGLPDVLIHTQAGICPVRCLRVSSLGVVCHTPTHCSNQFFVRPSYCRAGLLSGGWVHDLSVFQVLDCSFLCSDTMKALIIGAGFRGMSKYSYRTERKE